MKANLTLWFSLVCLGAWAQAAPIQFAWDASVTLGVTNYVLFASTNTLTTSTTSNAPVKLNLGTNTTCWVEGMTNGVWNFAVASVKNGVQSDLSNVVTVEVPKAPANMRTVYLQYGPTVTNFSDTGFFRVRIQ